MEPKYAIRMHDLTVGYANSVIVKNIDVDFIQGKMTCILGANGAGKTTMLKTVSRIIPKLGGTVSVLGEDLQKIRTSALAKDMSVVLTNKIDIENLTGFEVASMGRYPHTGFFCKLTDEDVAVVEKYLALCSASYLRDKYFHEMSDGEKQKIMLARGLAQEADILLLDEPTSHLDIKHKLDLLHLLRKLCVTEKKTIICTLHEPDLAVKCCDWLVLVKGDSVLASGMTEDIVESGMLDHLYGFSRHQFNPELGMIEFPNPPDKDVYLIGSDSTVPAVLRRFNQFYVGFGIGVLHQNDIAFHIAVTMDAPAETVPAYTEITQSAAERAYQAALEYRRILVCDFPVCSLNEQNKKLAERLKTAGKEVIWLTPENRKEIVRKICMEKSGELV